MEQMSASYELKSIIYYNPKYLKEDSLKFSTAGKHLKNYI